MSVDRLRVGFIGAGRHATKVLYPSLRYAPIELVAVCDLDEDRARRNQNWFGAKSHFTSVSQMLIEAEIDAVIGVAGPSVHPELAEAAILAGLPVLIEKPPALDVETTNRLVHLSHEQGTSLTVGMMKRFAPIYERAKAIVDGPEFGPVAHVAATFRVGAKGAAPFALLLDAGIHMLDLLRWLIGPYRLAGFEKWDDGEGVAFALLVRFESGAVGTVHISDRGSWHTANESVEITGNHEVIRTTDLLELHHLRDNTWTTPWRPGFSIPQDSNNSLVIQGYVGVLRNWADSLLRGEQAQPTVEEVSQTMALIKAIEPDEIYEKRDVEPPHWQEEDSWLGSS